MLCGDGPTGRYVLVRGRAVGRLSGSVQWRCEMQVQRGAERPRESDAWLEQL